MTSFLQLNVDLKASSRLNCSHLHEEGSVCVSTCCVLTWCDFFCLFFVALTFSRFLWAAGVIGLSHILLHQSLNMTTDWWWFQRLRVMTVLSPSLWSHFAICLFSPFPFFLSTSGCLHLSTTAQFNLFRRHEEWQVLCFSLSEKLSAEELVPVWTLGKMCVWLTRMNYSSTFAGLVEMHMIFLRYVMCASISRRQSQ